VKIAVVICTHNRPDSLARTLSSLAAAEAPLSADWQILVVDNAGCAATPQVTDRYRDRLPIAMLAEPEAGLARARNAAVRALDCDYFLWTDDDVTVGRGWLRAYEAAFAEYPEAAFFGGAIRPQFEGEPPAWLLACLPLVYTAYAGRDLGSIAAPLDGRSRKLPFGANFAVRAREQRAFPYDVRLGRQPGPHLLSGEESDVLRRICRAGGRGVWLPDAAVVHWIDRRRQTIAYLRSYYEGWGFARVRSRLAERAEPDASAAAHWRDLLRSELAYRWGWMAGRPETWVEALKRASMIRGARAAHRDFRRSSPVALETEG
jgi:glycosyltransferase involved in cell wall biosynthesis